MPVKLITTTRCIGILIPKNNAWCSLSLKIPGIAAMLTMIDNAVEMSGAAQRNFLLK